MASLLITHIYDRPVDSTGEKDKSAEKAEGIGKFGDDWADIRREYNGAQVESLPSLCNSLLATTHIIQQGSSAEFK
ncbi:hypothetical protein TWF281_003065 [Arthrobotrys megalospora]